MNTVLEQADMMSSDELDKLPYGMIQLDATGRILHYNAVESKLASLRKEDAIGKQFFTEIAPCTKVQDFYGRFKEGVIRESLDTSFRFHFAFKQNPRDVTVRLLYSRRTRTVWVLIADHEGKPLAEELGLHAAPEHQPDPQYVAKNDKQAARFTGGTSLP